MEKNRVVHFIVICMLFVESSVAQTPLKAADELFRSGKFDAAETKYRELASKEPADFAPLRQIAKIALIRNDLAQAELLTKQVLNQSPYDSAGNWLMAEILRRQDRYTEAVPYYTALNKNAAAKQMSGFVGLTPYEIEYRNKDITELEFVSTDPLPIVNIRVHDSDEALFILDTGGAGVLLDKEFADGLGVQVLSTDSGLFAGGRRAVLDLAKIETMHVGDFTVSHVPVSIQNMRRYDAVAGGRKVSGILGTGFFSHFITTIDYVKGKLVLARRSSENLAKLDERSFRSEIPFWIGNTHILVAWGTINAKEESLLFIDTGLAMQGVSFTCPESTMERAGFKPLEANAVMGQGGGGQVRVVPFMIEELQLGSIKQTNTMGITGAFPQALEYQTCGFRVGGLISHGFFRQHALTFDFDNMRLRIN